MPSNGGAAIIRIPARVYPGMFKGEVQISISVNDREINLIVSEDFVEFDKVSSEGAPGVLIADVVSKTDEGILVHLPGEVQGATNRVELSL